MVKLPPIVRRLQEWLERVHTWKWVLDSIGFGGLTMSVVGLVQALRSRLDWVALGALFVASSLMLYIAMRHAASAAPEAVPPAPPDPTKEERQSGVVSAEELRATPVRLSGEVFAIELLKRPIKLQRNQKGHVAITVDRTGVQEMIISNKGKMAKVQQYVTLDKADRLLALDKQIQSFLAGSNSLTEMQIDLPTLDICLRWPSGGVLSIVTDNENNRWVPLFFRDIRPYGWNIALGTPERWFTKDGGVDPSYSWNQELIEPEQFILREFLEESLIVAGTPRRGGSLSLKKFRFRDGELATPVARSDKFNREHRRLRQGEDALFIEEAQPDETAVSFRHPQCSLHVRLDDEGAAVTNNVLVSFSLLDLGIEVVKVVEYTLGRDEWMLDGEIKENFCAETGKTDKELIRMPIAMLSLDYLKKTFGGSQDWQRYTFGPQPSIKVAKAPDPTCGEIKLFDWDVRRRMEAMDGKWGNESQRNRFLDWYDKFGEHFIKDRERAEDAWNISDANPSRLFVPATAKILNLYFSMVERGLCDQ